MRRLLAALLVLAGGLQVRAEEHGMPRRAAPVRLMAGLGDHRHPIATAEPEAQRFLDQGLNLVFAFNHEEAVRSFARAAELDPKAAMPRWGIALALGPNINLDVDPARERAAYDAVQKALALARGAPAHERAYVEALARRYANDNSADLKALAADYKNAMGEVVRRYPDDLDAATLYAESAMDLHPWQLWQADGTPTEGTEEITAVLESVLKRDPLHPGANHYYVHAVEASPHPERALPSAARLETLVPGAGHLVHMPAHIYMRTGDYLRAAQANERAVEADRAYVAEGGHEMYALMYYAHDFHFMAAAYAMAGRGAAAQRAAGAVVATTRANAGDPTQLDPAGVAMVDLFLMTPTFVGLRVHDWAGVLAAARPRRDPARLAGSVALRARRRLRSDRQAARGARRARGARGGAPRAPRRRDVRLQPRRRRPRARRRGPRCAPVGGGGRPGGCRHALAARGRGAGPAQLRRAARLVLPGARVARRGAPARRPARGGGDGLPRRSRAQPAQSALTLRPRRESAGTEEGGGRRLGPGRVRGRVAGRRHAAHQPRSLVSRTQSPSPNSGASRRRWLRCSSSE